MFSVLYTLYRVLRQILGTFVMHKYATGDFWQQFYLSFVKLATGQPYYHLWYLFTLVGLYFVVPFVIRLAANLRVGGWISTAE